jgi:hypothetical protein
VQPPFHVTGNPNADWIIFIGGVILCLYWLRALRLAREGAKRFLRYLALAVLVFIGCRFILTAMHVQSKSVALISFVASVCVFVRRRSVKRSRHIPNSVKRAVIARDLKNQDYDSRKYHVDHVWPFSRGGSHTPDNLRVIEKKKNLKKGAKRPRMREMW